MKNAPIIIISILSALLIIYLVFKKRIDIFLKSLKDQILNKCKNQFYIKLADGKTQALHSSNAGTETNPEIKYYKNDVTITEDGITGATAPVEITEQEFKSSCKLKYDPPYEWYIVNASEIKGHRNNKK